MSQEGYRISDNDEDGNDDNDDDNLTKKRKSTGGNKSKKNPFDNKLWAFLLYYKCVDIFFIIYLSPNDFFE